MIERKGLQPKSIPIKWDYHLFIRRNGRTSAYSKAEHTWFKWKKAFFWSFAIHVCGCVYLAIQLTVSHTDNCKYTLQMASSVSIYGIHSQLTSLPIQKWMKSKHNVGFLLNSIYQNVKKLNGCHSDTYPNVYQIEWDCCHTVICLYWRLLLVRMRTYIAGMV